MSREKTSGSFKVGHKGGRPKGTPNRLTTTVREGVLSTFNTLQSDPKNNLLAFATKYPRDFYNIASKLIPQEMVAVVDKNIHITHEVIQVDKPQTNPHQAPA